MIQYDFGHMPNPTPAEADDYDSMCLTAMGMTYCESCGPDELECVLPIGHPGPHYDRDAHHWEDVYRQQSPDDHRWPYWTAP